MFSKFFQPFSLRGRVSTLGSPVAGNVIALSDVKDQTFANGLLGEGVAVESMGGKVVAPSDGKVSAIFPTGYAVALHTVEGLDVLIHVGLDTFKLGGRHFTVHAAAGDEVRRGDVLIEFDRDAIASEGYDLTVPIIICNSVEYAAIKGNVGEVVSELDELIVARAR